MPKRTNPFGECSPLQFKSHICGKDVERRDVRTMNSVYEKTKAMLFEGSRKTECEVANLDDLNTPRLSPPQQLPGQLRLDSQGAICGKVPADTVKENSNSNPSVNMETEADPQSSSLPTGQMVIDFTGKIQRNKASEVPSRGSVPMCCTCNHSSSRELCMCTDCSKNTCVSCMQQCYQCEQGFCQFCTKSNSQDYLERPVCCQCAVQMGL